MHLKCSKGSFYGEHFLMRPEAFELHMQNRAMGLPFVSNGFVEAPQGWLLLHHEAVELHLQNRAMGLPFMRNGFIKALQGWLLPHHEAWGC